MGARLAVVCALVLTLTVLTVYGVFGFGVFQFTSWHVRLDLPFPLYIIVKPIVELLLLAIILMFARYNQASLSELGVKRADPKILARFLVSLVPLYLLTVVVTVVLTSVFGPDPMADAFTLAAILRDSFQLVAYVIMYLVLVGSAEELAFMGFVQKGLENSFGRVKDLLIASVLFGLSHIAN